MERIEKSPGTTQTELARELLLSKGTVSHHIIRLKAMGLVRAEGRRNERLFLVRPATAKDAEELQQLADESVRIVTAVRDRIRGR